ncbi:MAG: outer membrane protein assembly factor BamD [Flavobacteriaceae bacterium]|jgi:outer membrane protein assembly factor BamD|nr:outer membrane protein assembly factor BamD [Flavobacteriaceae bacterium]
MKLPNYLVIGLLFLAVGCSDYQKALKTEDPGVKNKLAQSLYEQGKYRKAAQLYEQLKISYRGKPQAERIIFFYANSLLETKNYILAAYEFETFVKAYPKSQKADEAYFLLAHSYYMISPNYSLDQTDTYEALDKLQEFINRYPQSERMDRANAMVEELRIKTEKKGFENAKQYNTIRDYKAAMKALDNFIADNPGTSYREGALFVQFSAATTLAINSVPYKKENRLEDAKSKFENFARLYPESTHMKDAKKLFKDIEQEILTFASN